MTAQQFRTTKVARSEQSRSAWGQPLRHISRVLRAGIGAAIERAGIPAQGRVLDFGCADSPYRNLLPPACAYVGADLPGNGAADVAIAADGRLPLPDAAFDMVLSTQVLEHARDPGIYLRECYRVLKPGGALVLTTHGIMVWHPDPNDYWRWTCEGLQLEIERVGLRVEHFDGIMGLGSTGLQLFQDATLRRIPRILRRPYAALMQALVAWADRFVDNKDRHRNALVFVACARKPTDD